MKKIAIYFNSPYLGGAERSMVQQLYLLNIEQKVEVFIPYLTELSEAEDLIDLISNTLRNVEINFIKYPKRLFNISRSNSNFLMLLISLIYLLRFSISLKVNKYSIVWANGNKIALPIMLNLFLFGRGNKLIWHFRDYPEHSIFMKVAKFLFKNSKKFYTFCIGNSLDVSRKIDEVLNIEISNFAYNPVGDFPRKEIFPKETWTIGTASMFAPWKGIHQVIVMANIYKDELKELGIKNIKIFGNMIYKTDGVHNSYFKEIQNLSKDNELIEFSGNAKPIDLFNSLDILIHSSVKPEPFGRILVEAYRSGTCVLSSGLGGSGELIEHKKSGLIFQPYDYADMFNQIKEYINDFELQKKIHEFSYHKAQNLQKLSKSQIDSFFEMVENR